MAQWTSYELVESEDRIELNDLDLEGGDKDDSQNEALLSKSDQAPSSLERTVGRVQQRYRPKAWWLTAGLSFAAISSALVIFILVTQGGAKAEEDVLKFVDPLIGTGRGGHVFAGATLPFGMAKAVADVDGENMAGFASDNSKVIGFSHMHDSGTGGSPSLGNFPIFLHPRCGFGDEDDNIESCGFTRQFRATPYKPQSVNATPGYFSIELVSGIRAEMTTTAHAALYKFTFTNDSSKGLHPVMLADADCLPGSPGPRTMNVDPSTGRMTGEGNYEPSFGLGKYDAYFCADFQGAAIEHVGGFNSSILPGVVQTTGIYGKHQPKHGVYIRFKDVSPSDVITARVGVSWLSIERACENAEREVPHWDFERIRTDAEDAWREKLAPISISSRGINKTYLRNFWSGIYRAFINPQDYTGENQLHWNSTEPYFDSWYCIWDTFRGVHPFYTLVDPEAQSRMVRSLVDVWKFEGFLPDCRMSFCKGYTQGGSNADIVLVDGFVKKLQGIDWDAAYEALIKDAEVQPSNWNVEGRGGLQSWKAVGYIPYQDTDSGGYRTRSISRTVEYAYNDFCIAQIANATGRKADFEKYSRRASNWKNLYREDFQSMGFSGFLQPRYKDGKWGFQNATLCSSLNNFDGCYLGYPGHETYEGSPWLYTFYVPGDMQGLIDLMGGRNAFLERLNALHDSGVLYMGDEQAFMTAFLYHYAGRPGLSAKRTHSYIPHMFNDTIAGLPGNDDSGAMGTFVFFSMLGIFPNAGQSVYFIIPPFFEEVKISSATIRSINFDPEYKNIYIQSARLNGKAYTKNWVDHDFFASGGTLELVLGDTESDWGTGEADVPPSLTSGLYLP